MPMSSDFIEQTYKQLFEAFSNTEMSIATLLQGQKFIK